VDNFGQRALGGLFHVLEQVPVRRVMMHDASVVLRVLGSHFRGVGLRPISDYTAALERGAEFAALVDSYGIPRVPPVVGSRPAPHIAVLGPTPDFYTRTMLGLAQPTALFVESLLRGEESLSEVLDEKDDLSPLNQASIVLAVIFGGRVFLFPGDANVAALSDVVLRYGSLLRELFWLQVPHHGSKRNLSSNLIRTLAPKIAVVSAGLGDRKHPSRAVLNAFEKVGTPVFATQGNILYYRSDGLLRPGFVPAIPINRPFTRYGAALLPPVPY